MHLGLKSKELSYCCWKWLSAELGRFWPNSRSLYNRTHKQETIFHHPSIHPSIPLAHSSPHLIDTQRRPIPLVNKQAPSFVYWIPAHQTSKRAHSDTQESPLMQKQQWKIWKLYAGFKDAGPQCDRYYQEKTEPLHHVRMRMYSSSQIGDARKVCVRPKPPKSIGIHH